MKSLIEYTSRQWLHSKPPLRDASALRNYFFDWTTMETYSTNDSHVYISNYVYGTVEKNYSSATMTIAQSPYPEETEQHNIHS